MLQKMIVPCLMFLGLFATALAAVSLEVMTPEDVAKIQSVRSVVIAPDGRTIAYTLSVPREPGLEDDGKAWTELHVLNAASESRPFITGEVNVGGIQWRPGHQEITFTAKRGDDKHSALWAIPVAGGEAYKLVDHATSVKSYSFNADGSRVAFLAQEDKSAVRKDQKKHGFSQNVYEEQLRYIRIWILDLEGEADARLLEVEGSASQLHWSPTGDRILVALAPTPLIDDRYMARTLTVIDVETGSKVVEFDHQGKLGGTAWSQDGNLVAAIGGSDINDPKEGRLKVGNLNDGLMKDVLPGYLGHVSSLVWVDGDTIRYVGHQGLHTEVAEIDADGTGERSLVDLSSGAVFRSMSVSKDGKATAFAGQSPDHPSEVFRLDDGEAPQRLTVSNGWLAGKSLGIQEELTWTARDGLELEGILIKPKAAAEGRLPLVVVVHGGPEAHYDMGWLSGYSRPAHVFAGRGFAVFYPNYRGSTGRGVEFSELDQGDAGGKEFDDIVDGVRHLVEIGLVDEKKVGITGGSYGGFASAWGATYYSEVYAAAVMSVGITDQISKSGTTDIPNEMSLVHWKSRPWEKWQFYLERSPIYYVEKGRTPILIMHGEEDPRVHPSQSLELFRYLKSYGKVPVRLVTYPGEGHGNRRASSRYDFSLRLLRWMDHYLVGEGGEPPPPELDYSKVLEAEDEAETEAEKE